MQNLIAHLPLRHLRRFIGITERKDGANLFGFWHAGYLGRYGFVTIPHDDRSQLSLIHISLSNAIKQFEQNTVLAS